MHDLRDVMVKLLGRSAVRALPWRSSEVTIITDALAEWQFPRCLNGRGCRCSTTTLLLYGRVSFSSWSPVPWLSTSRFSMAARVFTPIIIARGTLTPLGVSRSSARVASAASKALTRFYLMEEVEHVDQELSSWRGAKAGTVFNCTAAGNTLAVAAVLCGTDLGLITNLHDLRPMLPNRCSLFDTCIF